MPGAKDESNGEHEAKDESPKDGTPAREYDRTGFYPENGKPFRIWALLGWNLGVIVLIAIAAAVLNFVLLD